MFETKPEFMLDATRNLELNNSELKERKVFLSSLPVVVNVATTSRCQMNPPCVMCLKNKTPEDKGEDISMDILLRAGYILDSASTVLLHGVGEPMVYPHLFKLAALGSASASKHFTTNGLLMKNHISEIVNLIQRISISVDAASKKTYKRIRHHDLNILKDGIRMLVRGRGASETPKIDISMCLMQSNMEEAADFVSLGHELGVDTVHFYHLNEGPEYDWKVGWFNYKKEHCSLTPDRHDKEILKAFARAKALQMKVIFDGRRLFNAETDFVFAEDSSAPPLPEDRPFCVMPWRNIQINSDGSMMNCCYQTWSIGTLKEKPFIELWNGENQTEIRKGIISGNLHVSCKNAKCPARGRL